MEGQNLPEDILPYSWRQLFHPCCFLRVFVGVVTVVVGLALLLFSAIGLVCSSSTSVTTCKR